MYFTVETNSAGLGDRIAQLRILYALGRSYGFTYLHTPWPVLLKDVHVSSRLDCDDFLGLSRGHPKASEFQGARQVRSASSLLDLPPLPSDKDTCYVLQWDYAAYHCGDKFVHNLLAKGFERFPLRNQYWRRRYEWPIDVGIEPQRRLVVLHYRRGDLIAEIASGRLSRPIEPISKGIDVVKRVAPDAQVIVISDGYDSSKITMPGMTDGWNSRDALEREEILRELPQARLMIGETCPQDFYRSVHAIALADFVIGNEGSSFACNVHRYFGLGLFSFAADYGRKSWLEPLY